MLEYLQLESIPFKDYVIITYISLDSVLNPSGFPIDYRPAIITERMVRRIKYRICSLSYRPSQLLLFRSTISPSVLYLLFVVSWLQTRVPPCCQRPYKHFAWLFHERGEAFVISAGWTDFTNLESFLSRGAATRDPFDLFAFFSWA